METPEPRTPLAGKDMRLRRLSVRQQRVLWCVLGFATGMLLVGGMCLAVVPVAVTLAVLSSRRGPHWRWRSYLVGSVAPYVLAVVALVAGLVLDAGAAAYQLERFDPNGWRTRPDERARWVQSLLRSDRLAWRTRTEVLAQLGPPEPWADPAEPQWIVPPGGLGVRRHFAFFTDEQPAVHLTLDEHDRVVRVRLAGR